MKKILPLKVTKYSGSTRYARLPTLDQEIRGMNLGQDANFFFG